MRKTHALRGAVVMKEAPSLCTCRGSGNVTPRAEAATGVGSLHPVPPGAVTSFVLPLLTLERGTDTRARHTRPITSTSSVRCRCRPVPLKYSRGHVR